MLAGRGFCIKLKIGGPEYTSLDTYIFTFLCNSYVDYLEVSASEPIWYSCFFLSILRFQCYKWSDLLINETTLVSVTTIDYNGA